MSLASPPDTPAPSGLVRIVDASVGVKWVINEEDTPHALALLDAGRLVVPDRFYSEVANVLWKRTRRQEPSERITRTLAQAGLAEILGLDLDVIPSAELAAHSLELALETGRSTYDCDYLALALQEGACLVTADARLYRALESYARYFPFVQWVDPTRPPMRAP